MRRMVGIAAVAALGLCVAVAGAEDKKPNATLRLSGGSIAAGVGVAWSSGTLAYKGKRYPVEVTGLTVGDVGITKIEASGDVYGLRKLSDFDGNYTAAAVGATVAGGAGAAVMKNQNGVTVELVSTTQGVKITVGGAGVSMKIRR